MIRKLNKFIEEGKENPVILWRTNLGAMGDNRKIIFLALEDETVACDVFLSPFLHVYLI